MSVKKSQVAEELTKFYEAMWIELPLAAGMRLTGQGDEGRLREAGWKAYDAWVRLANEATNRVYANPVVGGVSGRLMETALRAQQAGDAIVSAVFGNLWPAIGLPSASEMHALRDEVAALREEIHAAGTAEREERPVMRPQPVQRAMSADEGLHLIWKRAEGDASRAVKEKKEDAAA
jgi:hypothetical protein